MPLIKHNQTQRIMHDAVVLDLSDLHRQAAEILERAHRQADDILAAGRAEAQQLIEAADERGYSAGQERGLEEGRALGRQQAEQEVADQFQPRVAKITEAWEHALEAWQAQRAVLLTEAKCDVLRFAFELARRITHRTVQLDPSVVESQLEHALNLLTEPTALVVQVHPEDRALAERLLPTLLERFGASAHAQLREDASIGRGGCRLRTELGMVDARIEQQLDRLACALLPDDRRTILVEEIESAQGASDFAASDDQILDPPDVEHGP